MQRQNTIAINEAWPSTLFVCDWGDHDSHAAGITSHVRELAAGYKDPIASNVARSAKPAEGLV